MAIPIIKKMKKDDIENCTRSKIDHSVIYNLDSDAAMIWDKEQIYLKNNFFHKQNYDFKNFLVMEKWEFSFL